MISICIIKLGADGDVLRTIPLALAIKKKFPKSHTTWITRGDIAFVLKEIPSIDKVEVVPYKDSAAYDVLYNFDIEKEATDIAQAIKAKKKLGFSREGDYPSVFNMGAEYYLNTVFDDALKKSNRKTYQEMMFELAEIPYDKEIYSLTVNSQDKAHALTLLKEQNLNLANLIGIHMGASSRWPSKVWSEKRLREFIALASKKGYSIMLFGGPQEAEKHQTLIAELSKQKIIVGRNNPKNTKKEFIALLSLCKAVVCSDSFALHASLGLAKPTVGLFFCSSPWEVEDYGLLQKIVSPKLEDFFPQKMDQYDKSLTESIQAEQVMDAIEKKLSKLKK